MTPTHAPSPARRCAGAAALLLALCLLCLLARPGVADAARNIQLGLFDNVYTEAGKRSLWLKRTREDADARSVRIAVRWKFIAGKGRPADPTDPRDRRYDFGRVDGAVREATKQGLDVVLNLTTAPRWAEGGQPDPRITQEGAWEPNATEFGHFSRAVAKRYSGATLGLPRVRFYEAWNEPNYGLTHLAPQWKNRKPYGVTLYRRLLNAMYDSVKAVHGSNKVVAPSLGPFGRVPNGSDGAKDPIASTRPLYFLRELFCLRHNRRMTPKKCPAKRRARFDILSHHPINPAGSPRAKATHPDSIIGGDLGRLNKAMRKAEKAGNVAPGKIRRPLWVTEFWWNTNPPDRQTGVRPMKQARNIAEALYVFWRAKAQRAFGFMIQDTAYHPTGLYTQGGKEKPSLTAFRFPFVAERRSRQKVFVWGKSPLAGRLQIQQRKGGSWKNVKAMNARPHSVFTATLRLRGKAKLRASLRGGEASLAWPVKAKK